MGSAGQGRTPRQLVARAAEAETHHETALAAPCRIVYKPPLIFAGCWGGAEIVESTHDSMAGTCRPIFASRLIMMAASGSRDHRRQEVTMKNNRLRNPSSTLRFSTVLLIHALLALPLTGCADMMPRWGNPGTLFEQRNRATLHDPYPDAQLGPGAVDVRPREYKDQEAEARRSRAWRESGSRLGY